MDSQGLDSLLRGVPTEHAVQEGPFDGSFEQQALSVLRSIVATHATAGGRASTFADRFQRQTSQSGSGPSTMADNKRHVVYVHGICKHIAGFSNPWWDALHDYETTAFGAGVLGDTRLEVLWSDVITPDTPAAAMALAPALALNSDERSQASSDIRQELGARAASHALNGLVTQPLGGANLSPAAATGMFAIPAVGCVEDFAFYLANNSIRARVIQRFTDCIGPLLAQQADIDIVSHSWGTVVAYEGLRQLADQGLVQPRVRNLFTVGSALSLSAVKSRLRPQNKDGARPANVRRWVNVDAHGDIVGGRMKSLPYAVDYEFLELPAYDCGTLLGIVSPSCAHGSYFVRGNAAVNRDIFTRFMDAAVDTALVPAPNGPNGVAAAGQVFPGPSRRGPGGAGGVFATRAGGRRPDASVGSTAEAAQPLADDEARAVVQQQLGNVVRLSEYRATVQPLTYDERELLIDQARLMLEQIYAHLPLKRAMYGIDPIQRLRLLRLNHKSLNEREFQSAMIQIFVGLRDLHTNYILPSDYSSKFAVLPVQIEEFYENSDPSQRKYAITWVSRINTNPALKVGLVVTHWNGSPIDIAVERNADREAGSNQEAHRAQGVNSLALRWLGMSLPPDEDWVTLNCLDGQNPVEFRLDWLIIDGSDRPAFFAGLTDAAAISSRGKVHWGIDLKTAMIQRMRTAMFDPQSTNLQTEMAVHRRTAASASAAGQAAPPPPPAGSIYPEIFSRLIFTPQYGYIRLKTFEPPELPGGEFDVDGVVNEFVRLLQLVPNSGLILDVRGNGGGIIAFGERLLQLMTSRHIQPELFYLLITELGFAIAQKEPWLEQWAESMGQGIQTGASFSQGFPLTPEADCNSIGQRFRGPVVLITDALCYSTTDIFAAGFQDHEIGKILGVHQNTGAGGANVWTHQNDLEALSLQPDPFVPLPRGAAMRVAARRCTRQGAHSGAPLENLGVIPDEIHYLTLRDVLGNNDDLIAHAAQLL